MKIGGAFYCDECGCEIASGDYCTDCDPENGAESITYTFIATFEPSNQEEEDKPWWKKLFS
jgi:hypothetical protein